MDAAALASIKQMAEVYFALKGEGMSADEAQKIVIGVIGTMLAPVLQEHVAALRAAQNRHG